MNRRVRTLVKRCRIVVEDGNRCGDRVIAKGLCPKHYQQIRRNDQLGATPTVHGGRYRSVYLSEDQIAFINRLVVERTIEEGRSVSFAQVVRELIERATGIPWRGVS